MEEGQRVDSAVPGEWYAQHCGLESLEAATCLGLTCDDVPEFAKR